MQPVRAHPWGVLVLDDPPPCNLGHRRHTAHREGGDHGGCDRAINLAPAFFGLDLLRPRHVLRHPAIDFPVKVLNSFRAPLLPPHLRRSRFFPVLQCQGIGQVGIGIGLGLVGVLIIGRPWVHTVGTRPQGFDAQLLHHVLMILIGAPIHRRRQLGIGGRRRRLRAANHGRGQGSACENDDGRVLVWHICRKFSRKACLV